MRTIKLLDEQSKAVAGGMKLVVKQDDPKGKVMVEFMVQPDGALTDARVLKKMGSGLDEEALRLIKTAPKWEPATYKGRPLKQKMVLPVIFQL